MFQDADAAARVYQHPLSQPFAERAGSESPHLRHLLPAALQGRPEALIVERLHQVVQRLHFEGPQRIFVVGGDEDDGGVPSDRGPAQHLEGVALG
jgi:hypothetical protein